MAPVCSGCACQAATESEHVSKSVSMQRVEQLNYVLNSLSLGGGELSPNSRQKETLLLDLHVLLFWMVTSEDVTSWDPPGFRTLL